VFVTLGGPSVGLQVGAQSTDVVFVLSQHARRAPPPSRTSSRSEATPASRRGRPGGTPRPTPTRASRPTSFPIARSKGAFIGLSLEGGYLGIDGNSNTQYYGSEVDPEAVLFEQRADLLSDTTRELFLALLP
jgi:lipid-binding SYLF domain-containing protein